MRAREAELKRMDKDKELPVVVRLFCGGLAGGISQTGKSNSLLRGVVFFQIDK